MIKRILAAASVVACLFAGATESAARTVLVVNDTNSPPFTAPDRSGFLDAVAGEAFRRAGVELKLTKLPPERALRDANAGFVDGDLARIAGIESRYPNLVRVPEKLVDWRFTAYSRDASIPARWEEMRRRRTGFVRGWKIYQMQLADSERVALADDAEQLFRLLDLGRIEVALHERWLGEALIRRMGIEGVHAIEPPLATREMFIYVHRRHAALAPKLAEALRAIKAEGLYDRLYREKVSTISGSVAK